MIHRSLLGSCLLSLLWLMPSFVEAEYAPLPYDQSITLDGRSVRVTATAEENAAALRVGGQRHSVAIQSATAIEVEPVQISETASVLIVRLRGSTEVAMVLSARGRSLWTGTTTPVGDPGEREWSLLETRDRTGDGTPDVIVAQAREGVRLCGAESSPLDPRALDPASLRLRPVVLRPVPETLEAAVNVEVSEFQTPLTGALSARGASSGPPRGLSLVDGDLSTSWSEGRGGPGRWEFVTLGVQGGRPVHAVQLAMGSSVVRPVELLLVGAGADDTQTVLRLTIPPTGDVVRATLPEPAAFSCLSVVLDRAANDSAGARVGLSEVSVLTDLDFGGGTELLVRAIVEDRGEEGSQATHLLSSLGELGAAAVLEAWPTLTPTGKLRALRVAAANSDLEPSVTVIAHALSDADASVRNLGLDVARDAGESAWSVLVESLGDSERDPTNVGEGDDGGPLPSVSVALASINPVRATEPLLAALAEDGGTERRSLREGLRLALQAERDDWSTVRTWIQEAPPGAAASLALSLRGLSHPLRDVALGRALASESFEARYRTARAAEGSDNPDVQTWLTETGLRAEEWMVRREAARSLSPSNTAGLERALEDPYPRVRLAALELFSETNSRQALIRAARDRWPLVRTAGPTFAAPADAPLVEQLLADNSFRVRASALTTLTRLGVPTRGPVAERLMDNDEWPEVLSAGISHASDLCVHALSEPLTQVVLRALVPHPWDPDIQLAAEAIHALGRLGGADAAEIFAHVRSVEATGALEIAVRHAEADGPSCP